ncbi:MAG: Flp pilus assembly protein CpaB [Hyphomicrobiaceae bacterium]|nr:Flp pilus assembly protein CpaB [Hyphomicrobiaceae bacterium]
MNQAQLLGLAIAGVCGLAAFFGVKSLVDRPATVVREEVVTQTSQVLVARGDIPLGDTIRAENLRWQDWPVGALGPQLIERKRRPEAIKEITGQVARSPMLPGEPVTAAKVVKIGEGGVLAAILPSGMRAFSTRIKEETGAGRMILPNDRVDVMLTTRRRNAGSGNEEFDIEVLFRNVRVLAIGQLIEARDGKRLAEGNTATLELTPSQAEVLAAANARGEISFALRSIADLRNDTIAAAKRQPSDTRLVRFLRYGKNSSVRVSLERE